MRLYAFVLVYYCILQNIAVSYTVTPLRQLRLSYAYVAVSSGILVSDKLLVRAMV